MMCKVHPEGCYIHIAKNKGECEYNSSLENQEDE